MNTTTIFDHPHIQENTLIDVDKDDLVRRAQSGDLEAFNQLVLLYQERIFNLAVRMLGDAESAEDITQNTFLAAYRGLARFRNGSFSSWLYRIATNACYDELRRRKRQPVLSLEFEDDMEERSLQLNHAASDGILPEKEHERHEMEQAVQEALNRLDADQRAVIILVDLQDFDYQEAARIVGAPIGTVRSRLSRGRLRLQQFLSESGHLRPSA